MKCIISNFCLVIAFCLGGAMVHADVELSAFTELDLGDSDLSVTGNIEVQPDAMLSAGTGIIKLDGDFNVGGSFLAGSSTLELIGLNQSLTGDLEIGNLIKHVTQADTLYMPAGVSVPVNGSVDLRGVAGGLLTIDVHGSSGEWNTIHSVVNSVFAHVEMKNTGSYFGAIRHLIGGTVGDDYRMVGIGQDPDAESTFGYLERVLGNYDPFFWRMYHYTAGVYSEGSAIAGIATTGAPATRSVWLLHRTDTDLPFSRPVDHTTDIVVTLKPGWNMVGNPFTSSRIDSDIEISSDGGTVYNVISAQSDVDPVMHVWNNNGYETTSSMPPYEGVWMNNTSANDVLLRLAAPAGP